MCQIVVTQTYCYWVYEKQKNYLKFIVGLYDWGQTNKKTVIFGPSELSIFLHLAKFETILIKLLKYWISGATVLWWLTENVDLCGPISARKGGALYEHQDANFEKIAFKKNA